MNLIFDNVHIYMQDGGTALLFACHFNHLKVVEMLISAHAGVDVQCKVSSLIYIYIYIYIYCVCEGYSGFFVVTICYVIVQSENDGWLKGYSPVYTATKYCPLPVQLPVYELYSRQEKHSCLY